MGAVFMNVPELHRSTRYYHRERAKIIHALGGVCQNPDCGTSENLEICHTNGYDCFACSNYRPFALRMRDWKTQLAAGTLRLLCRDCHVKFDYGDLVFSH
jgi:hypothetical protein